MSHRGTGVRTSSPWLYTSKASRFNPISHATLLAVIHFSCGELRVFKDERFNSKFSFPPLLIQLLKDEFYAGSKCNIHWVIRDKFVLRRIRILPSRSCSKWIFIAKPRRSKSRYTKEEKKAWTVAVFRDTRPIYLFTYLSTCIYLLPHLIHLWIGLSFYLSSYLLLYLSTSLSCHWRTGSTISLTVHSPVLGSRVCCLIFQHRQPVPCPALLPSMYTRSGLARRGHKNAVCGWTSSCPCRKQGNMLNAIGIGRERL